MKNKGFTLIELLITITLITVISIAAGVGINEMFVRQRERNYEEFNRTITNAACTYAEINNIDEDSLVEINVLIEQGLLSKKLTDPSNKQNIATLGTKKVAIQFIDYKRVCTLLAD